MRPAILPHRYVTDAMQSMGSYPVAVRQRASRIFAAWKSGYIRNAKSRGITADLPAAGANPTFSSHHAHLSPNILQAMNAISGAITRRRFLRRLAVFASIASVCRYTESLLADEPANDPLGRTLPRRLLGRTGEKVTMLGLGGFHVGSLNDRDAQALIEGAIEGGIRFFDNAQQYQSGGSEAKYGRLLTPRYRDHIFLMTKTLARDSRTAERDLEGSLGRLRTDHLDLWQMHSVESPQDVDRRRSNGVFQVMQAAQQSGKTRHIGFSGHRTPAAHRRVLETTDQFATCQLPINAADPSYQSFIKNVLPLLLDKNLGVLAMKTLADQGFFGRNRWDARSTGVSALIPNRISVAEAIHFVWSLPVSVLITGAESVGQLQEKIALAQSFKGMSQQERERIIRRVADLAGNKIEYYKA
jgi:predicted aldo/keto reductase-like oxidoreductase